MAKPLNKILKTIEYSKGAPLPGGEAKFVAKHKVEVTPDANGNDDEVFKATKVQYANRFPHHGYNHDEDHAVYEETEYSEKEVNKQMKRDKVKGGKKAIRDILRGRQKTKEPVKEEVELDESAGDDEFDAADFARRKAGLEGRRKQRAKAGIAEIDAPGKDGADAKKIKDMVDTFTKTRAKNALPTDKEAVDAAKNYKAPASHIPEKKPVQMIHPWQLDPVRAHQKPDGKVLKGDPSKMVPAPPGWPNSHTYPGMPEPQRRQQMQNAKPAARAAPINPNSPKPSYFARIKAKLGLREDVTDEEISELLLDIQENGETRVYKHYNFFQLDEGDVLPFGGNPKPKKETGGTAEVKDFRTRDEKKKDAFFAALVGPDKVPTKSQYAKFDAMKKRED